MSRLSHIYAMWVFLYLDKQSRLNEAAADIVQELLPKSAENDLGSVCSWADQVKFRYHWSSPLHYVNTPDVCNYNFESEFPVSLAAPIPFSLSFIVYEMGRGG